VKGDGDGGAWKQGHGDGAEDEAIWAFVQSAEEKKAFERFIAGGWASAAVSDMHLSLLGL
jgi:hypothetical protein